MPSLSRAHLIDLRAQASLRTAVAALAIERHRQAHGGLPESLDQLVPDYLDAVPTDPFTGDPMKYVKSADGYTVYSVGDDLTDDGGTRYDAAGEAYEPGTDITFTVRRAQE